MKNREDDFERKLLRFKLTYNGAKIVDNLNAEIDYIYEDKYSPEQLEAIRNYKMKHHNTKTVDEAFFNDVLEKKNPFSY